MSGEEELFEAMADFELPYVALERVWHCTDMEKIGYALCGVSALDGILTDDEELVTCPECLKILGGK